MRTLSNCHVCGKPTGTTCSMCGRPACKEHITQGVCAGCTSGKHVIEDMPKDVYHK